MNRTDPTCASQPDPIQSRQAPQHTDPDTTVMVVDDYGPIRESLRHFLEHIVGVTTVREAGSGRDAISMAERIQPDYVITDSNLPDVSGVEVLRSICRVSLASRRLFISADDDQFKSAYEAGAEACILKTGHLFDSMRQLLSTNTAHSSDH